MPRPADAGATLPPPASILPCALLTAHLSLQGSRETSNGARVKLDVSDRQALPAFTLFPGQIVALEATNTDGESLHVTNIYSVGGALTRGCALSTRLCVFASCVT